MLHQRSFLVACLGALSLGCSEDVTDEPVEDGGTFVLDLGSGTDSFWIDTDGVDPEVAGCHIEFGDSDCVSAAVPARNFGEFCMDDGTLIESNPMADVCHTHDDDIGHPYVVDCVDWCRNTLTLPSGERRGIAAATGTCEVVVEVPCDEGVVESARCVCD
jgi:hypothetical protein